MSNQFKFAALFVAGMMNAGSIYAGGVVPYTTLYVGLDYSALNQPIATFTGSMGGKKVTFSGGPSFLSNLVSDAYGNVKFNYKITPTDFSNIKTCPLLGSDPNIKVCPVSVSGAGTAQWQVVIHNGLRANTIEEMIANRTGGLGAYTLDTSKPYYYEISAVPDDFNSATSSAPVPIVDLSNYFSSGDATDPIVYTLDSSKMLGNTPSDSNCNVRLISGLNQVSCADKMFAISGKNLQALGKLSPGIYQINVVASQKSSAATGSAFHTFYINVGSDNNHPRLLDWAQGQVASNNIIGDISSVYSYSHGDPDKGGDWSADFTNYSSDLQTINSTLTKSGAKPIKTTILELIDVEYPNNVLSWPVAAGGIKSSQVTTNRAATKAGWIQTLANIYKSSSVGITLSYTFANPVKAEMIGFNDLQRQYVAELMVQPILSNNLDGISMDLEGGFNQPNATALFKAINDRLAYNGKWFSFYYFGDAFIPSMVAAFGPLGVANISTYDVGQYRAPQSSSKATTLPGSISYDSQKAWTSTNINTLFDGFSSDYACSTQKNGLFSPVSYCNLTTNDSVSENNRRFAGAYHVISSKDAMQYFNGKYQLAFPIAASATEWEAVELWNPDLTQFKSGVLMLSNASDSSGNKVCAGLNNQFFMTNDKNLDDSTTQAYQQLSECLMSDKTINNVPLQIFSRCGNDATNQPIPYGKCLLVSNLPSSLGSGQIGHASVLDYIALNTIPYCDTNPNHYVGYSLFALENRGTAPAGAFGASSPGKLPFFVQEPWYVGYNPDSSITKGIPADPYYSTKKSDYIWTNIGPILKGVTSCKTPVPPPPPPPPGPSSCTATSFSGIKCSSSGLAQTVAIDLDTSANGYPQGVCVAYCAKGVATAVTVSSKGQTISADQGSGIFVNAMTSQCYDNSGKNGGNNVGPNTSGVFITQQYNAPKCTFETNN